MKEIIVTIFIGFLLILLFTGCTQQVVCDKPYIKVGTSCCLDQNDNEICDSDETGGSDSSADSESSEATTQPSSVEVSSSGKKTEILSHTIRFNKGSSAKYDMYDVLGEVKNKDSTPLNFPQVYFTGYGADNKLVCTKSAYAEFRPLNKDDTSPFELTFYSEDCPDMQKYKIKFEDSTVEGNITNVDTDSVESEGTADSDKCSGMIDLTVEGTESQQEICYNSKYIDYSISKNNVTICDEISSGYWLGTCYGEFAYEKKDLDICKQTPEINYTAKGYYEDLCSKDICYITYLVGLDETVRTYTKVIIPENICEPISNEQLKETCNEGKESVEAINELI